MSLKKTLGTLILAGTIAVGSGCATHKPLTKGQGSSELTPQQKIGYIVNEQRNFNSYGGNLHQPLSYLGTGKVLRDMYDDGFQVGNHTFGTRINADENGLIYISLFADNIFVGDYHGDGVDSGEIFAGNYHPVEGNRGNPVTQEIPFNENGSNGKANEFQNAVLDVIVEKYRTGNVNQSTLNRYETTKSNLLGSLK